MLLANVGKGAKLDSVETSDQTIAGVNVRVYRPAGVPLSVRLPVMLHFHGGGFYTCGLGELL